MNPALSPGLERASRERERGCHYMSPLQAQPALTVDIICNLNLEGTHCRAIAGNLKGDRLSLNAESYWSCVCLGSGALQLREQHAG